MQLKREIKTAKSLWSVGTEKVAERVVAVGDAPSTLDGTTGRGSAAPTSLAQLMYRPKWIDEAKRLQAILTIAMLTCSYTSYDEATWLRRPPLRALGCSSRL